MREKFIYDAWPLWNYLHDVMKKHPKRFQFNLLIIPRDERGRDHPKTPPKHLKYSRRAWEGLIKSWRKKLHAFDSKCGEAPAGDQ